MDTLTHSQHKPKAECCCEYGCALPGTSRQVRVAKQSGEMHAMFSPHESAMYTHNSLTLFLKLEYPSYQ